MAEKDEEILIPVEQEEKGKEQEESVPGHPPKPTFK